MPAQTNRKGRAEPDTLHCRAEPHTLKVRAEPDVLKVRAEPEVLKVRAEPDALLRAPLCTQRSRDILKISTGSQALNDILGGGAAPGATGHAQLSLFTRSGSCPPRFRPR